MSSPLNPSLGAGLPRLMAFDLDGTLLDPTGNITQRSVNALLAAHAAGVRIVLATGRPPFMMHQLIEAIGPALTHGVLANGAIVCTFPDAEPLRTLHFEFNSAVEIITRIRVVDPSLGFALATDRGFAAEPGFLERMPSPTNMPVTPDVLVASEGAAVVVKLFVFHPTIDAHELMVHLAPHVSDGFEVFHMGAEAVEIGAAGIDKASGLQWLCAHLGIEAHEVMAFGDNTNDHSMLVWVGRSVAMGNSSPATQALATDVALSNADDGVAVFIEQLLEAHRRRVDA